MSISEENLKKLSNAVLSCSQGCALDRLHTFTQASGSFIEVAKKELGATLSEAWGIMSGWDSTQAGYLVNWPMSDSDTMKHIVTAEWDAGFAIGQDMFLLNRTSAMRFYGRDGGYMADDKIIKAIQDNLSLECLWSLNRMSEQELVVTAIICQTFSPEAGVISVADLKKYAPAAIAGWEENAAESKRSITVMKYDDYVNWLDEKGV